MEEKRIEADPGTAGVLQEGDHVHLQTVQLKSYLFPDIPALTLPTTFALRKSVKQETYSVAILILGCGRLSRLTGSNG